MCILEDFKTLKKRIKFKKMSDGKMRNLDFCDCTAKYWFYLKPLIKNQFYENICLLIKLNKENVQDFEIGVISDEGSGFIELEQVSDEEIKAAVLKRVNYLVDRGLIRINKKV